MDLEFKRFCPCHGSNPNITDSVLQECLRTKGWSPFVSKCESIFRQYVEYYVPMLMVSYANNRNMESGELVIGIDDDGEVVGIPVSDRLLKNDIQFIKDMVVKALTNNLSENNVSPEFMETIISRTHVSFRVLEKDSSWGDDMVNDFLEAHQKRIDKYNLITGIYQEKKKRVLDKVAGYRQAINLMINKQTIRRELARYINECSDVKLDDITRTELLERLKNDEPITFAHGQITREKNDPHNMAYWIAKFRDENVIKYQKQKPPHHLLVDPGSKYKALLQTFPLLTKRMLNDGVTLGVLDISFPGGKQLEECLGNKCPLYLCANKDGAFRNLVRKINVNGEPCCTEDKSNT